MMHSFNDLLNKPPEPLKYTDIDQIVTNWQNNTSIFNVRLFSPDGVPMFIYECSLFNSHVSGARSKVVSEADLEVLTTIIERRKKRNSSSTQDRNAYSSRIMRWLEMRVRESKQYYHSLTNPVSGQLKAAVVNTFDTAWSATVSKGEVLQIFTNINQQIPQFIKAGVHELRAYELVRAVKRAYECWGRIVAQGFVGDYIIPAEATGYENVVIEQAHCTKNELMSRVERYVACYRYAIDNERLQDFFEQHNKIGTLNQRLLGLFNWYDQAISIVSRPSLDELMEQVTTRVNAFFSRLRVDASLEDTLQFVEYFYLDEPFAVSDDHPDGGMLSLSLAREHLTSAGAPFAKDHSFCHFRGLFG